jgi:hypothetical protein
MNALTPLRPVITRKRLACTPVAVGMMVQAAKPVTRYVASALASYFAHTRLPTQAFTYNTYTNSRGPLVLVPRNNYVNGGQGPGQSCLTASQGKLLTIPCNPDSPSPEQQFYLGFK